MNIENGIFIEDAKPDEWDEAMTLVFKTFLKFEADEYGKAGTDSFMRFISDERLFKMFEMGLYKVAVAKDNGKIVGVSSLRNGNHISLLFVDEKYHGQHIGKSLISYMQKHYLCDTKNDSYLLTVYAAPYAVEFYKHIGFFETASLMEADGITYIPMTLVTMLEA